MPVFLDYEASSLDRVYSYPIEVGWVDAAVGEPESYLIQPDEKWGALDPRQWDPASEAIHGIDRTVLEVEGTPAVEVARRMNAVMAGKTIYVDADVDFLWTGRLFEAAQRQGGADQGFDLSFLQTLMAQNQPDEPGVSTAAPEYRYVRACEEARQRVAQRGLPQHRAGPDALAHFEVYRILMLGY